MEGDINVVPFIVILVMLVGYIFPTFIAFRRRHPNRWPILIIDLAFGATVIGWLAALVWAVHAIHKPSDEASSRAGESGLNLFANDPLRIVAERAAPRVVSSPTCNLDLYSAAQRLEQLKMLHDAGTISNVEFRNLKDRLLKDL